MMKKIILFFILFALGKNGFAQKETFDLVTYLAPKNWVKAKQEDVTSYTTSNNKTNGWCRINIVKSTQSKGDINRDFESEWQEMVVKNYKPAGAPQMEEVQEANGWKIKTGGAKFIFNNSEAMVFLTTATGYDRCASIVAVTNSSDYVKDIEALLASVDLKKPETNAVQPAAVNNNNSSLIGTWGMSASDNSDYRVKNGIMSTIFRQYTFKENGSYTCNIKTFDPIMSSILLGRETGIYRINGNSLAIIPQKSVLEEWSKKNNADQWGRLLKTQNIVLEKVTYSFSKIFIPDNNEWQLILKAAQTKRDGPFNNYERDAWIYIISSPARPVIKLPN